MPDMRIRTSQGYFLSDDAAVVTLKVRPLARVPADLGRHQPRHLNTGRQP